MKPQVLSAFEKSLKDIADNSPDVKQVHIQNCQLNSEQVKRLADAVAKNTNLEVLHLIGCIMGEDDWKVMLKGLDDNRSLIEVHTEHELNNKIKQQLNRMYDQENNPNSGLSNR